MNHDYFGLARALAPEATLVAGAFLTLALDLASFRKSPEKRRLNIALTVGGLAVATALILTYTGGARGAVFGQVFMFDSFAVATRGGVLVLALFVFGATTGTRVSRRPSEYVALLLFATVGLLLMAAAQQLLVTFLALELASLSLYVLTGFDASRRESSEAALKYFLFGGMSAAFLLFGFSLLYGIAGSIELPQIAAALTNGAATSLRSLALAMIVVALGYKTAAAPFHLWAPDAYQGAPPPAAALIASASKLSALVLFSRLLWPGLGTAAGDLTLPYGTPGWSEAVALLAGSSMLLGNIAALAQTNVRRLLAYSAIAHAGSLLLGLLTVGTAGFAGIFYYAFTYGLATVGAFAVIASVEQAGACDKITDLAGLHRRSPLLAGCLVVFILSLAGIPPLAGFFGKFFVYAAALKMGGLTNAAGWLAIGALFLSAVSLYYYLLVLKQAVVAPAAEGVKRIKVPAAAALSLVACAAMIIVLGIFAPALLRVI